MKISLDSEAFLFKIIEQARDLLNADGASIFLIEGDDLVLKATTGPNAASQVGHVEYKIGTHGFGRSTLRVASHNRYISTLERPLRSD